MVNQQPEGFGEQGWFPQLPEGFDMLDSRNMSSQGLGGLPPGMGIPGYSGMYGPQSEFGASGNQPGFSPMQGPPGGFPGFSPGQQFGGTSPGFSPGQQFPGFPPGFPPGQQRPGRPPGFPPGQQFPGRPPGFPPGQQAPSSPPPNVTPEYPSQQLFAVDPGAIRGCLFRFTFIWLSRRRGFWFFPVFVGRNSVAGFRWRSRLRRWEYTGLDLDTINRFSCF